VRELKVLKTANLSIGVGCAIALAATPLTAEFSSAYTPLKLEDCEVLKKGGEEAEGGVWKCTGYDGIDVRVAEGDLRIFVSYGPNAETQSAAYETLPQFNMIGETLEWRLASEGGKPKPVATILRFKWDSDLVEGSTLVITKLAKDNACHMAYVEATNNAQANEQARALADKDAAGFICKRDKAKHYGLDGKEIKGPS
jgi:hypothetical protein